MTIMIFENRKCNLILNLVKYFSDFLYTFSWKDYGHCLYTDYANNIMTYLVGILDLRLACCLQLNHIRYQAPSALCKLIWTIKIEQMCRFCYKCYVPFLLPKSCKAVEIASTQLYKTH